jgi:ubiquinone/menaquinone biosynthesis C-methylase UbiE
VSSDLASTNTEVSDRAALERGQARLIEAEQVSRYLWAGQAAAGRVVLDAGCGTGYGSRVLAASGAGQVTGVDVASAVLAMAASEMPASVRLQAGDLHKLDFEDDKFELIVCFEVIEYVGEPLTVLEELVRVLAPGGLLLVSSPNRDVHQAGNPSVNAFTSAELERALATRLSRVRLLRQQDYVASALVSDDPARRRDSGADHLALHEFAVDPPPDAMYTIAMASDAELPAMRDLAAMGGTDPVREWLSALAVQAATIADKDHQIDELHARLAERDRLTELLGEAELRSAEVPELKQRISDLEYELAAAHSATAAARQEADQLDRMLLYGRRMLRYVRPLMQPLRRLRRKLRG